MRLILAHPAALGASRGESCCWIYGDSDGAVFSSVEQQLAGCPRRVTPERFQECATELADSYVLWCDEQIRRAGGSDEWVLSPYSRNPFETNQFVHLIWLYLLGRLEPPPEPLMIVTSSPHFATAVESLAIERGWQHRRLGATNFVLATLKYRLHAIARFTRDMAQVLWRWWATRRYVSLHTNRGHAADTVVVGYCHGDEVDRDGNFNSRYLPGLAEFLMNAGARVVFFPIYSGIPLRRFSNFLQTSSRSRIPFLWPEAYWSIGDILCAAIACWRRTLAGNCEPERFLDLPTRELVAGQQWRSALGGLYALLIGKTPENLAKRRIVPGIVMEWFENQPVGRASALGWARAKCRHVSLRQYASFRLFTNLRVTSAQLDDSSCPSEEWVCGAQHVGYYSRYAPHIKIKIVPALRYQHLYRLPEIREEGVELLVLLTHSRSESLEILNMTLSALGGFEAAKGIPLRIKPHPDHSIDEWASWLAKSEFHMLEGVEFVRSKLDNCLLNARLAVSSGSGAAIEAVCEGIPVIWVGRQAGLEANPLEDMDARMWTKVYDVEQMRSTFQAWLPSHPLRFRERVRIGRELRDRYFSKVDDESMRTFLA